MEKNGNRIHSSRRYGPIGNGRIYIDPEDPRFRDGYQPTTA